MFAGTSAYAQTYPSHSITIVVPYAAGGGNDVVARIAAKNLSEILKQPVIVDNRPGGGGTLGSSFVARAPADGYTLLMVNAVSHVVAAGLYAKLGYDPVKDFSAVGSIADASYVVAIYPGVPAHTIEEFVQYAKAHPHQLNYASGGVGAMGHIGGELLKTTAGIDLVHVPYKGGAPAIADLLAGNVQMLIEPVGGIIPLVRQGKLRGLAVTTKQHSDKAPEIPTMEESGYPGFEIAGRYGLLAPVGTPAEVLSKLNTALAAAVKSPDMAEQLLAQGVTPQSLSSREFQDIVKSESIKWLSVIRNADIKPE